LDVTILPAIVDGLYITRTAWRLFLDFLAGLIELT